MQVFVDADACPVREEVEDIASLYFVPVTFIANLSSDICPDWGKAVHVDANKEAADIAIANRCQAGDIVVTHDIGLAALAQTRGAHVIHPNGWLVHKDEIFSLLARRKCKDARLCHMPPRDKQKKRTGKDDEAFAEAFRGLLWDCLLHEQEAQERAGY